MSDSERLIRQEQQAREVFEEVDRELRQIPGVVEVGIGLKRRGGEMTDIVAFRVYVEEKLPISELPPEHVIPEEIRGFPTDVIRRYDRLQLTGFNDEDDWRNYPTKVGGIRIGSRNSGGTGTLGCFARRNSDSKTVFLSNHHVLFAGSADVGSEVGQPKYTRSCCCSCNSIGMVAAGDEALDSAIATLNDGVAFIPKLRKIRQTDGSVELTGNITGTAAAVLDAPAYKVGARTGLTRGTIEQTFPDVVIDPQAAFPRMAYFGDSGSVALNIFGEVIGLVKQIDQDAATGVKAIATPIAGVLTHHDITILTTDETQDYDVAEEFDDLDLARLLPQTSPLAPIAERLGASEAGHELARLFNNHREECLELANARGAFTVAWRRSQGPTWLAAMLRSAKEPSYHLPPAIEGVTREQAARAILASLEAHGSEALRADAAAHADRLTRALLGSDTLADMLLEWERSAQPAPAPAAKV